MSMRSVYIYKGIVYMLVYIYLIVVSNVLVYKYVDLYVNYF